MARASAGAAVEIAADQQEKEQRDGGIEIGMLLAHPRLVQADDAGQRDADRNRHVHVGPPGLERREGRAEERPAGIGHRRQGDGGRQPMEERARRVAHRAVVARPYGDRQQHHVGGGEARHGKAAQQEARFAVVLGRRGDRVVGRGTKAQRGHQPDMIVGLAGRAAPAQRQAARGKMRPGALDGRIAGEQALEQPDAGGTVEAVDQQVELGLPCTHRAGIGGEIGVERHRPVGVALFEPAVERAEPRRADDRMRAGAAGAAEGGVAAAAHDLPAMRADACRGRGRRRGEERGVGHRRNIRRVTA